MRVSAGLDSDVSSGSVWLMVCATSFMILAVFWSWYSYPLLVPTLMEDMNLSYIEAALPMSVLAFSYMILQIPSGALSDRYGARLPTITGILVCSVSSVICGLSDSLDLLLLGRLLFGVGSGLCFIPAALFLMANTPPELRGRAVGIYGASTSIGGVAAFLVTPLIKSTYGWRGAFIFPGVIEMIAALTFFIFAKPAGRVVEQRDTLEETKAGLGDAVLSREIWILNYLAFIMLGVFITASTWVPTYLMETYGLAEAHTGFLLCLLQASTVAGMSVGGLVSDRFGRKAPLLMSFPPSAVAIATISFLKGVPEIALSLILIGFFLQFAFSSVFAIVLEVYGPSLVGKLNGMVNTFGAMGATLLTTMFAYLLTVTGGYVWPFAAIATLTMLGALLSVLIRVPGKLAGKRSSSSAVHIHPNVKVS